MRSLLGFTKRLETFQNEQTVPYTACAGPTASLNPEPAYNEPAIASWNLGTESEGPKITSERPAEA